MAQKKSQDHPDSFGQATAPHDSQVVKDMQDAAPQSASDQGIHHPDPVAHDLPGTGQTRTEADQSPPRTQRVDHSQTIAKLGFKQTKGSKTA